MYKVLIRPLKVTDSEMSYMWRNDSDIWQYTGKKPDKFITKEIELLWIQNALNELNSYRFAILVNDTYVGNIQITDIIKGKDGQYHIFIGDKRYWGKGIGTLATFQLIRFAKEFLFLNEIYLYVKPENRSAIRVYEKCGFKTISDEIKMVLDLSRNIKPMVSVFMMTYNHENFIQESLESILFQETSFDFDIIIGDDKSLDSTRSIILNFQKDYPGKFKLLFHGENIGALSNQKSVFDSCTGKYVAICEGDDYWTDPHKLQKQVDFLEDNPLYGMVHAGYRKLFADTGNLFDTYPEGAMPEGDIYEELLLRSFIGTPTALFRNCLVKEYYELFGNQVMTWPMGDRPLWLYIASKTKIGFINEFTAVYRRNSKSATSFKNVYNEIEFFKKSYAVRFYFIERVRKVTTETQKKLFRDYYSQLLKYYSSQIDNFNSLIVYGELKKYGINTIDYLRLIGSKNSFLSVVTSFGIGLIEILDQIKKK